MRSHRKRVRVGFTLIELLVVVAILALLVAILLPALARARKTAQATACGANVRAIGQAEAMYAGEWDQYVVRNDIDGGANFWAYLLGPMLGGGERVRTGDPEASASGVAAQNWFSGRKIFQCPSLERARVYTATPIAYNNLHYVINNVSFKSYNPANPSAYSSTAQWVRLPEVPGMPSEVLLGIEMNNPASLTNLQYIDLQNPNHIPSPGANNIRSIKPGDQRHLGKTTVAFFDGHVEILPVNSEYFPKQILNPLDPRSP